MSTVTDPPDVGPPGSAGSPASPDPGGDGPKELPPRLRRVMIGSAVGLAIVAVIAGIGLLTQHGGAPSSGVPTGVRAVDEPLPPIQGRTLGGKAFGPDDYRGKVTVVNVWATWCAPCRREQPQLQRAWEQVGGGDVVFVGVNERDDAAQARTQVAELGVTYPSVSDADGEYAATLDFLGLPDTYIVDATGTIRYVVSGETSASQVLDLVRKVSAGGT